MHAMAVVYFYRVIFFTLSWCIYGTAHVRINYDAKSQKIIQSVDIGWFSRHHILLGLDCTSEDVSNGSRLLRCPGSVSVGMQKHLSVRYITGLFVY